MLKLISTPRHTSLLGISLLLFVFYISANGKSTTYHSQANDSGIFQTLHKIKTEDSRPDLEHKWRLLLHANNKDEVRNRDHEIADEVDTKNRITNKRNDKTSMDKLAENGISGEVGTRNRKSSKRNDRTTIDKLYDVWMHSWKPIFKTLMKSKKTLSESSAQQLVLEKKEAISTQQPLVRSKRDGHNVELNGEESTVCLNHDCVTGNKTILCENDADHFDNDTDQRDCDQVDLESSTASGNIIEPDVENGINEENEDNLHNDTVSADKETNDRTTNSGNKIGTDTRGVSRTIANVTDTDNVENITSDENTAHPATEVVSKTTVTMTTSDDTTTTTPPPWINPYPKEPWRNNELLCPGVELCNDKGDATNELFMPRFTLAEACCTPCSCSADCGKYNRCCYKEMDTYKIAEKENLACLYTSTKPSPALLIPTYYMVETCENPMEQTEPATVFDVYGLMPVYSPSTDRIYKNQTVADCHGITDGEKWNANITCKKQLAISGTFEALFDFDSFDQFCEAFFIYPGAIENIGHHRCYRDMVDTCSFNSKPVIYEHRKGFQLNHSEIERACQEGPIAPLFIGRKLYMNPFCSFCSSYARFPVVACYVNDTSPRGEDDRNLMVLISMERVANIGVRKADPVKVTSSQLACLQDNQDEKTCTQIYCPKGRVRDPETNECMFLTTSWFMKEFTICLKLTSDTMVKAKDMSALLNDYKNGRPLNTTTSFPWTNLWQVVDVIFEQPTGTADDDSIPVNMFLSLHTTLNDPNIIDIEEKVEENLKFQVEIYIGGKVVLLSQLLYPNCRLESNCKLRTITQPRDVNYRCHSPSSPNEKWIEKTYEITQLSYCDQIELSGGGIMFTNFYTAIDHQFLHRQLQQGEFEIIAYEFEDKVRLCLDDSLYVRPQTETGGANLNQHSFLFIFSIYIASILLG